MPGAAPERRLAGAADDEGTVGADCPDDVVVPALITTDGATGADDEAENDAAPDVVVANGEFLCFGCRAGLAVVLPAEPVTVVEVPDALLLLLSSINVEVGAGGGLDAVFVDDGCTLAVVAAVEGRRTTTGARLLDGAAVVVAADGAEAAALELAVVLPASLPTAAPPLFPPLPLALFDLDNEAESLVLVAAAA